MYRVDVYLRVRWWGNTYHNISNCPLYADVHVILEAWYCVNTNPAFYYYRTLDSNEERVKADTMPGGGEVNARHSCTQDPGWNYICRARIDVDLVGHSDPADVLTKNRHLSCRPNS